ncbi:amino acid ABC transporter permease [Prosthecomicrobium hirschii]|uniref:amino acid ABC transporter permease n=1 Tax=Prosthecodimorpha hirschii TaxID=665126 RepID=UPI00112BC90C|nr:amino acid ABC transporter permease [Prosthecomicrobium hirschii]TPQ50150.1 amino acid ABC transporter permease [Prosthecomicrobium hirschii]
MIEVLRDNGFYLLVGEFPHGPPGGLLLTLLLAACTMALVLPGAILVALARTSGRPWFARPALAFVSIIRAVPVLLIIFWTYLFVPVLTGVAISGFVTIVAAITIYQTAYLSEVIRAGIEALPRGQIEAGRALGLRYWTIMLRIVLPQVLVNTSPGILNVLIIIVKETSLGYMVGLGELTLTASHVNSLTLTRPLEVFAILSLMYFVICYSLGRIVKQLEKRVGTAAGH